MERKARTEQREPSRERSEETDGGDKVYQVRERPVYETASPSWQELVPFKINTHSNQHS